MFGELTETDRHTATLNYEWSTVRKTKPTTNPQNTFGLIMGPKEGTRSKTLQVR